MVIQILKYAFVYSNETDSENEMLSQDGYALK
jgi:hypothetical protein